jgi:hypothetical protein
LVYWTTTLFPPPPASPSQAVDSYLCITWHISPLLCSSFTHSLEDSSHFIALNALAPTIGKFTSLAQIFLKPHIQMPTWHLYLDV